MTALVAINGTLMDGVDTDRFSVVTVFGAATPAPAWQAMFGWPASGGDAVPLDVRSVADRTRWAAKLDDAVRGADRAVLLVADGLGCAASAWWARLSPGDYVARIAGAISDLAKQIPADLPWVLRVDGHTDARPISTSQFPSNWALSAARAIAVVQYLAGKGIAPQHLLAGAFGEFQPLDAGTTEDAYARNRRIELKLTER